MVFVKHILHFFELRITISQLRSTKTKVRRPIKPTLPTVCPGCSGQPQIVRLACPACGTAVEGQFGLPLLARLSPEEQDFLANFVKTSGSLKEMSRMYGVSYPTMRNRLDALIDRLAECEQPTPSSEEA